MLTAHLCAHSPPQLAHSSEHVCRLCTYAQMCTQGMPWQPLLHTSLDRHHAMMANSVRHAPDSYNRTTCKCVALSHSTLHSS
mmetsp:Transcript_8883/g.18965  ORF Transcript_8883/g.18965 Transcript_8883/m.18965 type:complete len:82 (-) Transcript_8883:657-902(-)